MIVRHLSLTNFKNHSSLELELSPQLNCFVGDNGAGKTNIVDALHYLSVGKSFLGTSDVFSIKEGKDFFLIEAKITSGEKTDAIQVQQAAGAKKTIKKNGKAYSKISEHIGFLPAIIISPYDANLISDSGESRRRFVDSMLSQTDPQYLFSLLQYQKTLQQRNALLKDFARNRYFDADSLAIYDEPLIKFAVELYTKRKQFAEDINPVIQQYYEEISGGREAVTVTYLSDLADGEPDVAAYFRQLLADNLDRDRILTYTSKGSHKDDLIFGMKGHSLRRTGSQGQQKSFLIALKLAQRGRIFKKTGKTPILLLDDIFDKLDDGRVANLIELVVRGKFGQIFLTDTHRERTENLVKRIEGEAKIISVE